MSIPCWSSSTLQRADHVNIPLPNDRNDPPDLQQVYGRFTSSATQATCLEVASFEDCIAALVICPEHRKMALSYQLDMDLAWFPYAPLKCGQTYSDSIKSLLESVFPTIEFKVPKVIQRKRFQVPSQTEYVNMTLYMVELSTKTNCACLKESSQKRSSIIWESYEMIVESMADCLAGPEPLIFAKRLLENQQVSSCILQEYTLKSVSSWYSSPASEMVRKCAGLESIHVEPFLLLYGDFVKHCYPSTYMTLGKFESYVTCLPLYFTCIPKGRRLVFKAFDVDSRKYLDFYQLVAGLALMDPRAEAIPDYDSIRMEYIYRYFDREESPDGMSEKDFNRMKIILDFQRVPSHNVGPFELNMFWQRLEANPNVNSMMGLEEPVFPMSCQMFIEYSKQIQVQNPRYNRIFRSDGRIIRKLVSSLIVKSDKMDKSFELEVDYLKIDSSTGQWVDWDFIPYQIGDASESARVSWNPQDNFELPSSDEHVYDFLLHFIRHFVHSPYESRWIEEDYRVSVLPYIIRLCADVKQIFSQERRLLRISSPCYVFGDIHGSIQDIANLDAIFTRMGPNSLTDNYLMLGDYVDRGEHSIECIMYMFVFKVLAPQHFHMIRGNHEEGRVNQVYGFKQECMSKFGRPEGLKIWATINEAFNVMPFCAVIDEQIFTAHGGFPGPVVKLAQIEASMPTHLSGIRCTLGEQMAWNDPASFDYYDVIKYKFNRYVRSLDAVQNAPENFMHNSSRGCGFYYTDQAVHHFLALNNLSCVIRAHEYVPMGFKCDFGGRVITVFSSSNYGTGEVNMATVALVSQDKRIQIMRINHRSIDA